MTDNFSMSEDEQRRIFAKNLNHYIAKSGKQQKEIANELGFPPTTFNTWCAGKIMPKMGKVQAIADYFGILKTDLIDEKRFDDPEFEYSDTVMKIGINDERFRKIIVSYHNLSSEKKKVLCDFLEMFIFTETKGEN